MKPHVLVLAGVFVCGPFAVAQQVPAELLGTWAAAAVDCTRQGPSTLVITESSVVRHDVKGSINGSRIIGRRSLEVQFEPTGPDIHPLGARIFRLSTDGRSLFELSAGKVVETRRRCESSNLASEGQGLAMSRLFATLSWHDG